jgi:signal transduction histidine kinase
MKFTVKYVILFLLLLQTIVINAQFLPQPNEKVTIYLGWSHQFQFAGYYAAIEQGYFDELGLEVELVPGTGEDNINAIIGKNYDYGIITAGILLSSDSLEKLSVLGAIMQQSPVSLVALKSSGVNNLLDLNESNIVGSTETRMMLISAGVDINSVNFHGSSSSFNNLISGKYDAISFFLTDQKKLLGNDSLLFTIFRPMEYGINFYGECLFTSREEIKQNPERAQKIKDAVVKGWEYAVNHQDETIDLIQQKYKSNHTREDLSQEAEIIIHSLILPRFHDIGDMQNNKWEQMAELIYEFGLVDKPIVLEGFIFKPPAEDAKNLKAIIWIISVIVLIITGFLLLVILYNKQLKMAVKARTNSLEKSNQEMDRFVYSISHDIRSPLSSVQGLINIMKIDSSEHEKYLGLIESSIIKLDNYTKDILDYTRNSRAKVSPRIINLNEVVDKCVSQLKYADNADNIDFYKDVDLQEPFFTDPWRLEVILNNLLSNSVKYKEKSRAQSFVKVNANLIDDKLRLEIEDNGIGIDKVHLKKIYGMFYRASEDSRGSGLGLYIVSETVTLLQGSINIQSVVGEGTSITLEIPNLKMETEDS